MYGHRVMAVVGGGCGLSQGRDGGDTTRLVLVPAVGIHMGHRHGLRVGGGGFQMDPLPSKKILSGLKPGLDSLTRTGTFHGGKVSPRVRAVLAGGYGLPR